MSSSSAALPVELLTRAALAQGDACGRPALPDGTRVLELPVQFYFQRARSVPASPGAAINDTAYQYFDSRFQFVLRSIQYDSSGEYTVIFSNGRLLHLPPIVTVEGSGVAGRLDVAGTASDQSAGGIPLEPCDRVTMSGVNFPLQAGAYVITADILFIGVLRIFLRGGEIQPPYPTYEAVPRAIYSANQNIFSPETERGFQCYPETPAGFRDEFFWLASTPVTIAVPSGAEGTPVVTGQVLLPGDADFVWREWDFVFTAVDASITSDPLQPQVRFRTQAGENVSDDLVDCYSCQGPAFPETVLPKGSFLAYDVTLLNAAGGPGNVTIQFFFYGVRRFKV